MNIIVQYLVRISTLPQSIIVDYKVLYSI